MLNRMARALLCLTIIISATGYCFAQATGNIKGSVADPNGGLVAGATVEVVNNQFELQSYLTNCYLLPGGSH